MSKYHATTLVHTETAHIHAQADMKVHEDLGIEEYKYFATLDYRTCETCQPLDGQVFKRSEAVEGVNYPCMHPRCRCTTTMNMDYTNRRARNPLTGKNEIVDGDLTYKQWVDGMTGEQRNALKIARKKDANKTADKLQHAQYKKVLGSENVPKSFDKWQDKKYNNISGWDKLKGLYRKEQNNSHFKSLSEPMQKRHIIDTVNEAGIDYSGIKISRDKDLIGKGIYGYTFPDGKNVVLYPDAFENKESLIKTLGHERIHCEQIKLFGQAKDIKELSEYEKAASFSEEYWWQKYNERVK